MMDILVPKLIPVPANYHPYSYMKAIRKTRASLVARMVKNLPAVQETWVQSLGWEDPLEEGMTTHSSILAWRIPWTEELAGYNPCSRKESDTNERLSAAQGRQSKLNVYSLKQKLYLTTNNKDRRPQKEIQKHLKLSKKWGLPWWYSGWESTCQRRGHGSDPWSGKIPHALGQLSLFTTTTELRSPLLPPQAAATEACMPRGCSPWREATATRSLRMATKNGALPHHSNLREPTQSNENSVQTKNKLKKIFLRNEVIRRWSQLPLTPLSLDEDDRTFSNCQTVHKVTFTAQGCTTDDECSFKLCSFLN